MLWHATAAEPGDSPLPRYFFFFDHRPSWSSTVCGRRCSCWCSSTRGSSTSRPVETEDAPKTTTPDYCFVALSPTVRIRTSKSHGTGLGIGPPETTQGCNRSFFIDVSGCISTYFAPITPSRSREWRKIPAYVAPGQRVHFRRFSRLFSDGISLPSLRCSVSAETVRSSRRKAYTCF